ncbi:MAG: sensor histidine kinase [Zoogloeaceae bacterium]|nr:sensor histidine kinase [Zoogloeaceae bacterium]
MVLLAHLGTFLLWQPLVHGGYRFGLRGLLVLLGVAMAVALEASWGIIALWVMVLASLVAGGAFFEHLSVARWAYRLAMGYLILTLALLVLPEVLPQAVAQMEPLRPLGLVFLPALLLAMVVLPVPPQPPRAVGAFDLLSALLVYLVLAVVVLGAMAFMWLGGASYLGGLVQAIFSVAGALLVLAWVWNPRIGGEGLALKLSRRVLAAGVAFDDWLHGVAQLSLTEPQPLGFLQQACETLLSFPGVTGGRGEAEGQAFEFGRPEGAEYPFEQGGVRLMVTIRHMPSAAMLWYLALATQVLQEFYREKVLARRLRSLSYVEAVHQTGARLTHDVKNLLQSLETLCFAASRPGASPAEVQRLMQRQLPVVAARLRQTLDKLRSPERVEPDEVPLTVWWRELLDRHVSDSILWVATDPVPGTPVPRSILLGVTENLIQNASDKRRGHPRLTIRVALEVAPALAVVVEDDGEALSHALTGVLFHEPVASEQGLGMGLYQSAELARQGGWSLTLSRNERGCVRFRLTQLAPAMRAVG